LEHISKKKRKKNPFSDFMDPEATLVQKKKKKRGVGCSLGLSPTDPGLGTSIACLEEQPSPTVLRDRRRERERQNSYLNASVPIERGGLLIGIFPHGAFEIDLQIFSF
jgi:hypothetical protein